MTGKPKQYPTPDDLSRRNEDLGVGKSEAGRETVIPGRGHYTDVANSRPAPANPHRDRDSDRDRDR